MAFKSSGQISFSELATQFDGLDNPFRLSSYYREGTKEKISETVPTSGQISFRNFYGVKTEKIDMMILGGAGAGGGGNGAGKGGGGAGGMRFSNNFTVRLGGESVLLGCI